MKKYKSIFIVVSMLLIWHASQSFFAEKISAADLRNFVDIESSIEVTDNGLNFEVSTKAKTVSEFMDEQKITLSDHDLIYPEKTEKIYSGTHVIIHRAKKITIKEGGNTDQIYTFANTIEQAIWGDIRVNLGDDDVTVPDRALPVIDGMKIAVTHVLIKEEIKDVSIAFKTVSNEDDSLGWRVKKTTQKGETGTREVKYKVVYNDGKEISRKVLESNVTKQPVDEIVTQGTLVKVGKTYTGAASWYSYTGELCAANPWLPMGSYARVTNKNNGKSVIVKINDRGPFGNGRIIDLDKAAFSQISSLGSGVANVKVEAITN